MLLRTDFRGEIIRTLFPKAMTEKMLKVDIQQDVSSVALSSLTHCHHLEMNVHLHLDIKNKQVTVSGGICLNLIGLKKCILHRKQCNPVI